MLMSFANVARAFGFLALLVLSGCASLPKLANADWANDAAVTESAAPQSPIEQLEQAAAGPVDPRAQEEFESALAVLRSGELADAKTRFAKLSQRYPELAGPWVNLGYIHLHSGEIDAAEYHFAEALKANPQNCHALNQLGVIARRAGRFADAEKHYAACIDANPNYANAHLNLAILYELYMGRLGEALAAYNEYQLVLPEPDKKVGGWMMDLERRVAAIAKR